MLNRTRCCSHSQHVDLNDTVMSTFGRLILLLIACVSLAACQQGSAPDDRVSLKAEYKNSSGQRIFGVIDTVPVFRKNGVFWKHGASYRSVLSAPLKQKHADFELYDKSGLIAWTPNQGPLLRTTYAYFDADIPKGSEVFPFINVAETLYLIEGNSGSGLCSEISKMDVDNSQVNVEDFFKSYAKVDKRFFRFIGNDVVCVKADRTESDAWVIPIEISQSPEAIGFLFKGKKNQTIRVNDFHLGTHAKLSDPKFISVKAEDTIDGVSPTKLYALTYQGSEETLSKSKGGDFKLSRDMISGGPFRIWVKENNLDVFPTQGEWQDPTNLAEQLIIKQNVEFKIDPTKKNKKSGTRRRTPHVLSIWNGSTGRMKIQEYEGISFRNNWGKIDRDRFKENENNCLRGAIFGGSYVEAQQTKISEKPAIMAEAFASQTLGRCVEIFTYGRSTYRAENYVNDAVELISEFDIDFAVFSVSRLELCQHNDVFYNQQHGRDTLSPKNWRVISGVPVAPVPQDAAEGFKPNKEAAKEAIKDCSYDSTKLSEIEIKPLEKMKDIEAILKAKNNDLKVMFFNFKDVLDLDKDVVSNFVPNCEALSLNCVVLPIPSVYEFKEQQDRFSPYLYRYKNDGHPNVRANQYISEAIAGLVVDAYAQPE